MPRRRQDYLLKLNEQLRSIKDPFAIMEATAQSIGQLLKVDCVGYGEVDDDRGIVLVEREWSQRRDQQRRPAYRLQEFLHGMVDDSKLGKALAIEDIRTDPRTGSPAPPELLQHHQCQGRSHGPAAQGQAMITAILYVISSMPRSWSEDDVALVEDVAERTG